MNRILGSAAIIALLVSATSAQTTNTLAVVQFVDANTVVACGASGTLIRSIDGGSSWFSQESGTTDNLVGISFTSSTTGTAVGGTPLISTQSIVRTVNGGNDWTTQSSGNSVTLRGVSFVNSNTGWAVGSSGTILKTSNGGASWIPQVSGVTENIQEIQFVDANVGTAVGDWGRILRTTNGGTTWTPQTSGTNIFFYGISFINSMTGTVVGNVGTIRRTTNGGATWTAQTSGTTAGLTSVYFVDANIGYVAGLAGTIRKTTNGGTTWVGQTTGTIADLGGISFRDANVGVAVGLNGTILRTTNGGATWTPPTGSAYVTNQYPVQDGWNIVSVPLNVTDSRTTTLFPTAVSAAYEHTPQGYIARDTLKNGEGYWIFFSSSQNVSIGGTLRPADTFPVEAGWNLIGSLSDSIQVSSIQQSPPNIIASPYYAYNAGYSTTSVLRPSKGYWVFASASGNLVLSSATNPGKATSGPSDILSMAAAFKFSDTTGASQVLYASTEALSAQDLDFFRLPPRAPGGIFDARFSSNRMLETAGEGETKTVPIRISDAQYPIILRWEMTQQPLKAFLVIGGKELAMAGNGSLTITDEELAISLKLTGQAELPQEFTLQQNYPNPFNPSTTIRYTLPEDARVSLKLYNILGQEVATVVDADQKAGFKSVELNAGNLASGEYFYRLRAGDLVATKKLLLLK